MASEFDEPFDKTQHMLDVAARSHSPSMLVEARERADQISNWLARTADDGDLDAARLIAEPTVERKMIWLGKAMERLAAAAAGIAPCRDGCAHCCYMPTIISTVEAERIAEASGRTMAMLPRHEFEQVDAIDVRHYFGKPCPFLVQNRCSVYEARPYACRKHFSVDSDSLLCRVVPGEAIRAPSFNAANFDSLYVLAHGQKPIRMADIRSFFPPLSLAANG